MKKTFEKAALLSLSLILVSTYSISAVLPMMREFYAEYTDAQIDLLVSVPSFGILVVCLINIFFADRLKERPMVIIGLLLISVIGTAPVFCQKYPFVLAARFLLGLSVGMVNAKAVTVISERYEGREQSTLLGYRASAESVGNIIMTLCAGGLLLLGWTKVFWIYAFALPILALYLAVFGFHGKHDENNRRMETSADQSKSHPGTDHASGIHQNDKTAATGKSKKMSGRSIRIALSNACFAFLVIGGNSALTLRLSVIVTERGFGSASTASVVLGLVQAAAIISGILFGSIRTKLSLRFTYSYLIVSFFSALGVTFAPNLIILAAFSFLFSFANAGLVTTAFERISKYLPKCDVDRGTSFVLVGCNCGAFTFAFVVSIISHFTDASEAPLMTYSTVMLIAAAILVFQRITEGRRRSAG